MVVIITGIVCVRVLRPRIVSVPVIVVDRRVLVAGLTIVGVGMTHVHLLSRVM